jgi:Flp pilus assembly protein TadG
MSALSIIAARYRRNKSGAAAVEFAIVANFFALLLLGLFFAGYAFLIKNDLNRSLAAAERYALVHEEDDTTLESVIKGKLNTYDKDAVTMVFARGETGGVKFVKVDVSYVIDLGMDFILEPIALTSTRIFPT